MPHSKIPAFAQMDPSLCLEKSEECHADYIFTFAHLTYSDIFFSVRQGISNFLEKNRETLLTFCTIFNIIILATHKRLNSPIAQW